MQQFARTSDLGTAYSDAQIQALFTDSGVQEDWSFDLLDHSFRFLKDITKYVTSESAEVDHDATQAVKRALTIEVRADAGIVALSNCIRPNYKLKTPDGGWVKWSLGIFPMVPSEQDITPASTTWKIQCSDLVQLMVDAKFLNTYTAHAGDNYISEIKSLVAAYAGIYPLSVQIPNLGYRLQSSFTYEPGTEILTAINELLEAINYWPLWVDEVGIFRSAPIPNFDTVQPSWFFDTTAGNSIVGIPIKKLPDYTKIFNIGQVVVEDPRQPRYSVNYVNNNGGNPISTVNWRQKLKSVRKPYVNSSQAKQIAQYMTQYASMMYDVYDPIPTFPWPLSQDYDVYRLRYSNPDDGLVDALFLELGWKHRCRKGDHTDHTMARIYHTAGAWL